MKSPLLFLLFLLVVWPCQAQQIPTDAAFGATAPSLQPPLLHTAVSAAANRSILLRASTDEVILRDGTRVVGEIKKLDIGKLTVDTDDMDLVYIDWEGVVSLSGTGPFTVDLATGERLSGSITADSVSFTIIGATSQTFPRSEIAYLEDFDVGFWNRVVAGIDLGLNLVRGNNRVSQLSTSSNLGYHADKFETDLGGSALFNEQTDGSDTRRVTLGLSHNQLLRGRLRAALAANYEYDENQQLDYRVTIPAALGYRVISKLRMRMDLFLGGGPTFEKYQDLEGEVRGEGYLGTSFLAKPNNDTEIDLSFFLIPKLFAFDQNRLQSDLTIRFEIIDDLNFSINGYFRYNTNPPKGVTKDDYGITFGVGWSY